MLNTYSLQVTLFYIAKTRPTTVVYRPQCWCFFFYVRRCLWLLCSQVIFIKDADSILNVYANIVLTSSRFGVMSVWLNHWYQSHQSYAVSNTSSIWVEFMKRPRSVLLFITWLYTLLSRHLVLRRFIQSSSTEQLTKKDVSRYREKPFASRLVSKRQISLIGWL